jgi:uncharacterized protein (UPF0332 family)
MIDYKPEDYVSYRLQRAKETIQEVKIHIENGFWNTAVNRMYYACFYAVGALLVSHGVETATHSGARQKFGQLFVKPGLIDKSLAKHYTKLFEKRQKGDYNDFFDFDRSTVIEMLPKSEELIKRIEELIVLND